jgi:hypothetical protein
VQQTTADGTGAFDVTFTAGVDLPGLTAEAFGLSQPQVTTETAVQDDPDDPSTASVKRSFSLHHAGQLDVSVDLPDNDVDLFLLYDANGDGNFTPSEIVGSSTTSTGTESISVSNPPDGAYQVWVHGFSVAGSPTFPLTIDAVQGDDLTVTGVPAGAVPAGTPVTLHVTYAADLASGQDYDGLVRLGPPSAPGLISVPVRVHRE